MATKRPTKKAKDLSPKAGTIRGGTGGSDESNKKLATNDNLTLVRNAKPAPKKRDLPSRKDVKGGKKIA